MGERFYFWLPSLSTILVVSVAKPNPKTRPPNPNSRPDFVISITNAPAPMLNRDIANKERDELNFFTS